jgi:Carboxypeptidase regulatory-like domain
MQFLRLTERNLRRLGSVLLLLVFVSVGVRHLIAQSATSQVSGVVKDASGGAIPDAQIEIRNTDTNAVRTALSDAAGAYSFPSLAIGPYRLQVKKDGFETYLQTGIELQVGNNPQINVALQVGTVTQQVEVQANAVMVESQNTAVTQVINPQQVVDLPLNGRQATDLIALSGAAVNTQGVGGTVNNLDYPSAVSYSVAGSQANATNYYLDGAQNVDYRTNVGLPMPFPDALAEFNLGISAMPANLGIRPGGSVNAVTRSGTNAFHGGVFDFIRNGIMDATARTYPTTSGTILPGVRDTLVRNQFGGTIGGPIKRDRVFFFFGYQGTNQNSTVGSSTTTVPTAEMLNGDFSYALNPANGCSIASQKFKSGWTTTPTSNILQPSLLTTSSAQVAAKLAAQVPLTNVDRCGNMSYQASPSFVLEHQFVTRVDWQRNDKDNVFARYYITDYSNPSYYTTGNIYSSSGVGLADRIQTVSIGDTYVLSPKAINTLRLTFARTATVRTSNSGVPTICQLGMNATCPIANMINVFYKNTPGFLGYDYENSYGITEGFAWTNGKHQLNVGFNWIHIQMNNDGVFQMNPGPTFNTNTTGVTMGDFVTGNVDSYGQGNGQLGRDSQNQPSAYIQDSWKVIPRLQLTGGLRWDPFIAQYNKYGMASAFTMAGYQAGTISKQYVNAPPGVTFPGDAGFNGKSSTNNYYPAFAPRIGFVWDITGKGTQTLRSGYGYFYDTSILWNAMHIVLNPPWGETLSFVPLSVAAGGGLANPFNGQPGGNPFPTPLNPPSTFTFPVNGTYVFENQTNKPSYTQQWNLAYQIQATRNLLLSATYIGNKTTHVWLGRSVNATTYLSQYGTTQPCTLQYGANSYTFPICNSPSQVAENVTVGGVTATNLNARRALTMIHPNYGPLMTGGNVVAFSDGNGAYNGLLVSAQQRMAHGFSVLTNYTWSHCMDDGEVGQDIGNSYMNPNDRKANWGNCSYNRKGIFNLSLQAQTPKIETAVLKYLVNGWNGSGIFTASTGSNYNIALGYDYSLTGVGLDRPNMVGNPNVGGAVSANPTCSAPATVHNLRNWFNPCAFAAPAFGSYGGARRNDLVGPANWNLNLAVVLAAGAHQAGLPG